MKKDIIIISNISVSMNHAESLLPSVLLPVVITPSLVCVTDLFPLKCLLKNPCFPRLLGEPVVKVGNDDKRCAFRVTEANVYPVVPVERRQRFGEIMVTVRIYVFVELPYSH